MTIRICKKYKTENNNSFEKSLKKLFSKKVQDDYFAKNLYDCLCNTIWYNKSTEDIYSCSFRYAGALVAEMRGKGENYMDFYCNSFSCEGSYHKEIYEPLNKIGYRAINFKTFNFLQKFRFTGKL